MTAIPPPNSPEPAPISTLGGIERFEPNAFDADRHYYPRTLNAQIHPIVSSFFRMSLDRIVSRYCHLHPHACESTLRELLTTPPRYLRWSGSDILNVSTEDGVRLKIVLETNSCPSGQKSFPMLDDDEEGGYRRVIERTFLPLVRKAIRRATADGVIVVLFDKNHMESSGYAQVLATLVERPVYLVPCPHSDPHRFVQVRDRDLYVLIDGAWMPVICGFRYVTQRPWTRLPFDLRTPLLNPIVACLAGGRNKTAAAKAYELFNAKFRAHGLEVLTPESVTNVRKAEIPIVLARFGGRAVVKVPYLNAGQGIFTIVSDAELDAFMAMEHPYDEFIVQQLVGSFHWSSTSQRGRVFHIGTVPDRSNDIYAFDLRAMVSWQGESYAPVAMYTRRARSPLPDRLGPDDSSWAVLGTNLSRSVGVDQWTTEPRRLMMVDRKDFSRLGLGLDDLIEAFFQAVMANRAIDDLARKLVKRGGGLRRDLFLSLNPDDELLKEIR